MTKLLSSLQSNEITTGSLNDPNGNQKINVDTISLDGFYTRRLLVETLTGTYISTATAKNFVLGPVFPNMTGFKAGSLIHLSFHMPTRNDSDSWGGFYIEPQVRFNLGAWNSLGGSGFDLMLMGGRPIQSYYNSIIFDPQQVADFDMQFRFYFATYDNTIEINGRHNINYRSMNAAMDANAANCNQHFSTIKVEELAKFSGA